MAIALDAVATAAQTLVSDTLTISHTCSGSNRILFVQAGGAWVTSGTITGVTYNSVAMTNIDNNLPQANAYNSLWYLLNPSTGTNNIVITASSSGRVLVNGSAASYTGALQSGVPDSKNKANQTGTSISVSTTVVANGSWVVGGGYTGAAAITAGTGMTSRSELDSANASVILGDSNGAQGPGSYSMTFTNSSDSESLIVASFAPSEAPASGFVPQLLTLNVG